MTYRGRARVGTGGRCPSLPSSLPTVSVVPRAGTSVKYFTVTASRGIISVKWKYFHLNLENKNSIFAHQIYESNIATG